MGTQTPVLHQNICKLAIVGWIQYSVSQNVFLKYTPKKTPQISSNISQKKGNRETRNWTRPFAEVGMVQLQGDDVQVKEREEEELVGMVKAWTVEVQTYISTPTPAIPVIPVIPVIPPLKPQADHIFIPVQTKKHPFVHSL